MKRSHETEATSEAPAPAVEAGADGSDEGNKIDEVDSVGDEDIVHSKSEGDQVGSDMEDDHNAIDVERVQVQRRVASFICFQEVKPHLVKNDDFRNLMAEYCPSTTLDRETTKEYCSTIFEEAKSEVKRTLNNMDRLIALSVDMLTHYDDRFGIDRDFMCLAANFIDDDWELKKWILRFQRHEVGLTDFTDAAVAKALDDWNLMDKVYTLTSRNVDTIDETIESIKFELGEKNRLPLESHLFSVSCCAEMFGLMAEDAFEEISRIISKLERLHWSSSVSVWHITNSKLKNALDMESVGEFNSVADRDSVPSADEWEKIRIVYRLVESAYAVAKQVFEVKHPTANKFLYNLQELRANLVLEARSSDCFTCSLAKKMLQRLDKYIRETFLVLAIASVMDPRCKMQYIEYISTKFEDIVGTFQTGAVLEATRSIYADYLSNGVEREICEGTMNSKSKEENPECDKKQFQNSPGGQEFTQFVQTNDLPRKSDLDIYLEEPVLPWDENFNVLKWWKSEGPKYPNVSKMARGILAIPISVATSYDAYYYLENRPADARVITSGAQLINAVMCCRSWKLGKPIPKY